MEQKKLVNNGVQKVIDAIISKRMRSLKDLCKKNSSSLDGHYRVIVLDMPRNASYKPYAYGNFVVIEDRILAPGEKLVNKKGKIAQRMVIAFDTKEECQNIIATYKSCLMVGYQQKVWTNRHTPLDFTPAFDGDFTKRWSYSAMQQFLGLTSEEAKQMEWSNNYVNPLLSITGDKQKGIHCTSIPCIGNSGQDIMPDKKLSVKKFSTTAYRRKKCESIEDLHQLQSYVAEEYYYVLEYVLKQVLDEEQGAIRDEVLSLSQRRFNAKQKQQERRFKPKSTAKDDETTIIESVQAEKSAIENDEQALDVAQIENVAETEAAFEASNNRPTKRRLFIFKSITGLLIPSGIGVWPYAFGTLPVCTILPQSPGGKSCWNCTPPAKLEARGPP